MLEKTVIVDPKTSLYCYVRPKDRKFTICFDGLHSSKYNDLILFEPELQKVLKKNLGSGSRIQQLYNGTLTSEESTTLLKKFRNALKYGHTEVKSKSKKSKNQTHIEILENSLSITKENLNKLLKNKDFLNSFKKAESKMSGSGSTEFWNCVKQIFGFVTSDYTSAARLVAFFADQHGKENLKICGFSNGGAIGQFAALMNSDDKIAIPTTVLNPNSLGSGLVRMLAANDKIKYKHAIKQVTIEGDWVSYSKIMLPILPSFQILIFGILRPILKICGIQFGIHFGKKYLLELSHLSKAKVGENHDILSFYNENGYYYPADNALNYPGDAHNDYTNVMNLLTYSFQPEFTGIDRPDSKNTDILKKGDSHFYSQGRSILNILTIAPVVSIAHEIYMQTYHNAFNTPIVGTRLLAMSAFYIGLCIIAYRILASLFSLMNYASKLKKV